MSSVFFGVLADIDLGHTASSSCMSLDSHNARALFLDHDYDHAARFASDYYSTSKFAKRNI